MSWRSPIFAVFCALFLCFPGFARPAPDSFADLSAQLLPTVVNISTSQTLKPTQRGVIPEAPPGSPLEELYRQWFGPKAGQPRRVSSLGSGFIIDPSGLIVTNNHVITDADQITVTLHDGTSLPAKVLGRDDKTDLALLKVNPRRPLPTAHFGDSDKARIGDWVIAIGNPFGLGSTVTAGIVSARNRNIEAGPYDEFLQTDAPINRGNSGGPLFDMTGSVVGINSAIYSPSGGGSVGIGFAIPSNLARDILGQLRQFGQVRRGWVGVNIQQVTPDLAEGLGLPGAMGALVGNVSPGGPADKAGIKTRDVILSFDGKRIPDARTLSRIAAGTPIGKTVNVEVLRGRQHLNLHLTVQKLADPPKPQRGAPPKPRKTSQLGLTLSPLDAGARSQFQVPGGVAGVVVTDVDPSSPAYEKNVRAGDVIVAVQDQPVKTPDELQQRVTADLKNGRHVEVLLVNRAGALTYVALRF
jgi:serine protease Do